jgi:acetylornithine deacetylase
MKRNIITEYIDRQQEELVEFAASLIRARPVNPYFVNERDSEKKVQEVFKQKLLDLGLEVIEIPVDFADLDPYKGRPGYTPGVTDTVSFKDRPNLLARLPGTDPKHAPSVLLSGHCDVVAADDEELWDFPPFAGIVSDGKLYGRGASDMLCGLAGMVYAIEALVKTGLRPKGDIWFTSLICEEFGGTGTLAVADWMKRNGIAPDVVIMGEGTNSDYISLLCRGITFVDVVVTGRAGHLERTPEHWRDGGAVDAIQKARYIMDAIDRLNADWALRQDKDHPLLNDPCQAKVSMIKGGHHPSSYAETCTLTIDIQSLPHEQDENYLPTSVKKEFTDYLMSVCQADPWLRENPVEIHWKLDADCVEMSPDHPFVEIMAKHARNINGGGALKGETWHYDGGWFTNLLGSPCLAFGPGDIAVAHGRNEFCSIDKLVEYTKIVALACLEWCNDGEAPC